MNPKLISLSPFSVFTIFLFACAKGPSQEQAGKVSPEMAASLIPPASINLIPSSDPSNVASETPNSGYGISLPTLDRWTTPTPVPALQPHSWQPEHVLVDFGITKGDGPISMTGGDFPPSLILYADGRLILAGETGAFSYAPQMTTLDRSQICRLLNTIEQFGFFDFEEDSLHNLSMGGGGSYIEVNAWRSNRVSYQDFAELVACIIGGQSDHCNWIIEGTGWQALVNTYLLLDSFQPQDLSPYTSEMYAVYLHDPVFASQSIPAWPYSSLTIAQLLSMRDGIVQEPAPLILSRELVPDWEDLPPNGIYNENGLTVQVNARPLWPFEYRPNDQFWPLAIPDPSIPPPDFTLSCYPEDGVLPVPE